MKGISIMALEWLKEILGDGYTEAIDKKVSAEIGKGFVARADFNTLNETKKTLEATVADRDGQLEKLKKIEPDKLQAEIIRLQGENTTAKDNFDKQLKQTKLDYALETRLIREGAVNPKAVKALLDPGKISLDGENLVGIDEQLKTLKAKETWAFKKAEVPGAGGNPAPGLGGTGKSLPEGQVIF